MLLSIGAIVVAKVFVIAFVWIIVVVLHSDNESAHNYEGGEPPLYGVTITLTLGGMNAAATIISLVAMFVPEFEALGNCLTMVSAVIVMTIFACMFMPHDFCRYPITCLVSVLVPLVLTALGLAEFLPIFAGDFEAMDCQFLNCAGRKLVICLPLILAVAICWATTCKSEVKPLMFRVRVEDTTPKMQQLSFGPFQAD